MGPYSGPLCYALSLLLLLLWTSMRRGVRQWRRATVATPGEWQHKIRTGGVHAAARSGEWAQHFSNASCFWLLNTNRNMMHQMLHWRLYSVLSLPSFTGNRNNIEIFLYNWCALYCRRLAGLATKFPFNAFFKYMYGLRRLIFAFMQRQTCLGHRYCDRPILSRFRMRTRRMKVAILAMPLLPILLLKLVVMAKSRQR